MKGWLVVLVVLVVLGCGSGTDRAMIAADLEEHLFAPCCWRQSIRAHESEIASKLRAEIETRLASGEPAATIEADFVRRYGPQIRALSTGTDPRLYVASACGVAVVAGLVWIFVLGRRRREAPVGMSVGEEDESYTDLIDDELAELD